MGKNSKKCPEMVKNGEKKGGEMVKNMKMVKMVKRGEKMVKK